MVRNKIDGGQLDMKKKIANCQLNQEFYFAHPVTDINGCEQQL